MLNEICMIDPQVDVMMEKFIIRNCSMYDAARLVVMTLWRCFMMELFASFCLQRLKELRRKESPTHSPSSCCGTAFLIASSFAFALN